MSSQDEYAPLLPSTQSTPPAMKTRKPLYIGFSVIITVLLCAITAKTTTLLRKPATDPAESFWHNVTEFGPYCDGATKGWSGWIGLDVEGAGVKRSFFILNLAEEDHEHASLILTIGGGPGTSGHTRYWTGDGPCLITEHGLEPNQHRWTENFNYLAIDHPVGVGFSYGNMVNSSADAAKEMYDFLQKFYVLFPQLKDNQLVLNGGSYGGMYIPHMANIIIAQNSLLAAEQAPKGNVHIPLESIMISNPWSDPLSHAGGLIEMLCQQTHPPVWNSSQCLSAYQALPSIIQAVRLALDIPTLHNRVKALNVTWDVELMDLHGVKRENYHERCDGSTAECYPYFIHMQDFLRNISKDLGVPEFLKYNTTSDTILELFVENGDFMQQSTRFFPTILSNGIRILHRVGMLDMNCPWTTVLNSASSLHPLRLLLTPIVQQSEFTRQPDVPWPGEESEATIRVVGAGAGDFTYVQLLNAGHMVGHDAPRIEKKLAEHWVYNRVFR
ncbi:Alpha/Beta hydrolase protein [Naematelia encephala]|uniref:Alpha/Beta hydrolase protein n=1 Tax=Naematelia encephala TaxID=71784 RepID=A0A1Y2B427_9TREE|nr:Alpha/Beta hydrolase protein [Naematelia encephala]